VEGHVRHSLWNKREPCQAYLTEHGTKFERNSKSKECFLPVSVTMSLVGCGSRTRSAESLVKDFLNCSSLLAVTDYMKA